MKKIRVYINGEYVCSSNRFKTCSALKKHLITMGVVKVATVHGFRTVIIKKDDIVKCSYK